jgi:uncharacterized membrane protein
MSTLTSRRHRSNNVQIPTQPTRIRMPRVDSDAFGAASEKVARYFGTARFLVTQTAIVAVWIALNVVAASVRWDPYPFILLNLAFSTQAAYAAPFILLSQNRQADRDRVQIQEDRAVDARQRATTDYLATELASLRLGQSEAATRDYVDRVLARELAALREHLVAEIRGARG